MSIRKNEDPMLTVLSVSSLRRTAYNTQTLYGHVIYSPNNKTVSTVRPPTEYTCLAVQGGCPFPLVLARLLFSTLTLFAL